MVSRAIVSRSMIIFSPKSHPPHYAARDELCCCGGFDVEEVFSSKTRFLRPNFSFEGRGPRKFTSEKFRKKTKMKKTPTLSFLSKARTRFLLPHFSFEGRRPGKFMLELSEETRKKTKMKKPAADPPPPPIWLFQKQSSVKTKKTGGFSVEEIHGADKFVDDLRSLLPDVPYRAILLYNLMSFRGVGVDKFTFPFVMKACMAISCVKEAKEIYGFAVKSGFLGDVYLDNVLKSVISHSSV